MGGGFWKEGEEMYDNDDTYREQGKLSSAEELVMFFWFDVDWGWLICETILGYFYHSFASASVL